VHLVGHLTPRSRRSCGTGAAATAVGPLRGAG
jgi:hypothetical protein